MRITAATRSILRLAFGVGVVALLAATWELAARQSPGSPIFLGVLPGPIASLRGAATFVGIALLATAPLVAPAAEVREPRLLLVVLHVGAVLGLGASAYAAAAGMHAVQLDDPRPDAVPVFLAKHGGLGLFVGCLLEIARRAIFGHARPTP